jgi:hypothetical protein
VFGGWGAKDKGYYYDVHLINIKTLKCEEVSKDLGKKVLLRSFGNYPVLYDSANKKVKFGNADDNVMYSMEIVALNDCRVQRLADARSLFE